MSIRYNVGLHCDFCQDEISGTEGIIPFIEVKTNEGIKHYCKTCVEYETLLDILINNDLILYGSYPNEYLGSEEYYNRIFPKIKEIDDYIHEKIKERYGK